jgi:hypothetical protein
MPTRRAILKAAGAISALAAVPLPAQTTTPTPTPPPGPPPAKTPDLLAKLARERYGKFLTEEELPLLDEDMASLERRSARLRGYKLANSEEPAVDFSAQRS